VISGHTLALDQGSQSSRALVFDAAGALLAGVQVPVETKRFPDQRVEQDPAEIAQSLRDAIAAVTEQTDPELITKVGLATQRSSVVCWRKRDAKPLSKVLSWQDRRAADWLEQFAAESARVQSITGLLLSPHYGVSKLNWLLSEESSLHAGLANDDVMAGPLSSFLLSDLLGLNGGFVDPANASRTLLYDFHSRDWSDELLELFGIPRSVLPQCVPTSHAYGQLQLHGVDAPLTVCTGDQSAAMFAFGPARTDSVYANLGTGAFLQRPVGGEAPLVDGLLSSIVFSNGTETDYVLEGTVNGAGSAINWAASELGIEKAWLKTQTADWLKSVDSPPLFLNGVSGLGAPWWIADFPSQFVGEGEDPAKVVAVLESIVFLLQVNFDVLAEATNMPERWIVTGGLSQLDGLCQRLADLSRIPVARPSVSEATALGVAHLLNLGQQGFIPPMEGDAFHPQSDPELKDRYSRWHYAMSEVINNYCS